MLRLTKKLSTTAPYKCIMPTMFF
uniref:Uncharacterized protein n=1 Tax=Arundo donax TaxID=35708 RepID=A0A0A8ZW03_ARUDO